MAYKQKFNVIFCLTEGRTNSTQVFMFVSLSKPFRYHTSRVYAARHTESGLNKLFRTPARNEPNKKTSKTKQLPTKLIKGSMFAFHRPMTHVDFVFVYHLFSCLTSIWQINFNHTWADRLVLSRSQQSFFCVFTFKPLWRLNKFQSCVWCIQSSSSTFSYAFSSDERTLFSRVFIYRIGSNC